MVHISETVHLTSPTGSAYRPHMPSLYEDLEAFVDRHRAHGRLSADATEPALNGYLLAVGCSCGVVFERWITPEDADQDMLHSGLPASPN